MAKEEWENIIEEQLSSYEAADLDRKTPEYTGTFVKDFN